MLSYKSPGPHKLKPVFFHDIAQLYKSIIKAAVPKHGDGDSQSATAFYPSEKFLQDIGDSSCINRNSQYHQIFGREGIIRFSAFLRSEVHLLRRFCAQHFS